MAKGKAVVELTGLYHQLIAVNPKEIMRVVPHRVWTEVYIEGNPGGMKVLESAEEVQRKIDIAEGVQNDQPAE